VTEQLGNITGSGCMTGTLVATFCAAARLHYLASKEPFEDLSQLVQGDMLVGALAGYVFLPFWYPVIPMGGVALTPGAESWS
jgi:hypothetical protein